VFSRRLSTAAPGLTHVPYPRAFPPWQCHRGLRSLLSIDWPYIISTPRVGPSWRSHLCVIGLRCVQHTLTSHCWPYWIAGAKAFRRLGLVPPTDYPRGVSLLATFKKCLTIPRYLYGPAPETSLCYKVFHAADRPPCRSASINAESWLTDEWFAVPRGFSARYFWWAPDGPPLSLFQILPASKR